jgi:hypothetical protein
MIPAPGEPGGSSLPSGPGGALCHGGPLQSLLVGPRLRPPRPGEGKFWQKVSEEEDPRIFSIGSIAPEALLWNRALVGHGWNVGEFKIVKSGTKGANGKVLYLGQVLTRGEFEAL